MAQGVGKSEREACEQALRRMQEQGQATLPAMVSDGWGGIREAMVEVVWGLSSISCKYIMYRRKGLKMCRESILKKNGKLVQSLLPMRDRLRPLFLNIAKS